VTCLQQTPVSLDLFIFTLYLEHASAYASLLTAPEDNLSEALDVKGFIDTGVCICQTAAVTSEALLAAGGPTARALQDVLVPRLVTCGEAFSRTILQKQQEALDSAVVASNISAAKEMRKAVELLVRLPSSAPPPESHFRGTSATTAALLPLPSPPRAKNSALDAARFLEWVKQLPDHDKPAPNSTVYAALAQCEELMYNQALLASDAAGQANIYACHTIAELSSLTTEIRKRLRAASAVASVKPWLLVEYRSREALVIWITLVAIHRSAVATWPALLKYHLPLNPDDLHLLTLRSRKAEKAALAVAAYVAAHSGSYKQVFTTSAGNATMDLCADYVATGPSSDLRALFEKEANLAEERNKAHSSIILNKKDALVNLDKERYKAEEEAESAKSAVQSALGPLGDAFRRAQGWFSEKEGAFYTALRVAGLEDVWNGGSGQSGGRGLGRGRFGGGWKGRGQRGGSEQRGVAGRDRQQEVYAMLEYKSMMTAKTTSNEFWRDWKAATDAMKLLHSRGVKVYSGSRMQSKQGSEWEKKFNEYATLRLHVISLEEKIAATERPPPPVFHPLPDTQSSPRDARAVLFWQYPEHTGLMPHLAQYCFEAQQVRVRFSPKSRNNVP
jgi:hypothetical protein